MKHHVRTESDGSETNAFAGEEPETGQMLTALRKQGEMH